MTELVPSLINHDDQISPDSSDSESSDSQRSSSIHPTITDVGKRVVYYSAADKKNKYGVLRFIGETEFAEGVWGGVELNNASGKNNGTFKGIRYFTCESNHGVFVPINKLEMDFGRRSRPNSTPSSRSTSVERELVSKKGGGQPSTSTTQKGLNTLTLQQQLVNRLSAPAHRRSKTSNPPATSNNRRQPLKAFATKGVSREEQREAKKLPPFKSGGMMKARSTENINKSSSSSSAVMAPKMPSKKSSSERDLRGMSSKNNLAKKESKPSRKGRVNSCSDLSAPEPTPSKQWAPKPPPETPRTSTPGKRDELAPDGCSSPDDDSGSNTSHADDPLTPSIKETAFIQTPDQAVVKEPAGIPNIPRIGDVALVETDAGDGKRADTSGLESAPVLLIKNERANPSYNQSTITSPDCPINKRFNNRSSGSATLPHPLTQHSATQDRDEYDTLLSRLLDTNCPLEGVTVSQVVAVLREQHRRNVQLKEAHQTQLEALKKEYTKKIEEMERQSQRALRELVQGHQGEIMKLNRAHIEELKQYR